MHSFLSFCLQGQNLIDIVAAHPNATSVWLYLFSSNKIKILLVLPENESPQRKVACSHANSAVLAQKQTNYEKLPFCNL
jgi:hypothetical protein